LEQCYAFAKLIGTRNTHHELNLMSSIFIHWLKRYEHVSYREHKIQEECLPHHETVLAIGRSRLKVLLYCSMFIPFKTVHDNGAHVKIKIFEFEAIFETTLAPAREEIIIG
jgi:hypothetical protein